VVDLPLVPQDAVIYPLRSIRESGRILFFQPIMQRHRQILMIGERRTLRRNFHLLYLTRDENVAPFLLQCALKEYGGTIRIFEIVFSYCESFSSCAFPLSDTETRSSFADAVADRGTRSIRRPLPRHVTRTAHAKPCIDSSSGPAEDEASIDVFARPRLAQNSSIY